MSLSNTSRPPRIKPRHPPRRSSLNKPQPSSLNDSYSDSHASSAIPLPPSPLSPSSYSSGSRKLGHRFHRRTSSLSKVVTNADDLQLDKQFSTISIHRNWTNSTTLTRSPTSSLSFSDSDSEPTSAKTFHSNSQSLPRLLAKPRSTGSLSYRSNSVSSSSTATFSRSRTTSSSTALASNIVFKLHLQMQTIRVSVSKELDFSDILDVFEEKCGVSFLSLHYVSEDEDGTRFMEFCDKYDYYSLLDDCEASGNSCIHLYER